MYTIDFETAAIIPGSSMSPKPVGLAVKYLDEPAEYIAWGHLNLDGSLQSTNTHTFDDAMNKLKEIWASNEDILCHNAKFDMRICVEWFDLHYPDFILVHDTLFMAFLADPREPDLKLKSLADKYLDMPPQEQDDLKSWILENVKGSTESNWGAHICYGPVSLNTKYAIGDVDRTRALYLYYKDVLERMENND